jgi:hypothetical protein
MAAGFASLAHPQKLRVQIYYLFHTSQKSFSFSSKKLVSALSPPAPAKI